jgi:hypothetical protein
MPVSIDHLALPAADAEAAARWFAEIVGLAAPEPDGPDEDMFNVRLGGASSILIVSDEIAAGHCVALSRPKQLASMLLGYVGKPRDGH